MLTTAFSGQENFFDRRICEWLSQEMDLRVILWMNHFAWTRKSGARVRHIAQRLLHRGRKKGLWHTSDEFLYHVFYTLFLASRKRLRIKSLVDSIKVHPQRQLCDVRQIRPTDIDSPQLVRLLTGPDVFLN